MRVTEQILQSIFHFHFFIFSLEMFFKTFQSSLDAVCLMKNLHFCKLYIMVPISNTHFTIKKC